MKILFNNKNARISIVEVINNTYTVTIDMGKGLSITKNGLDSIQECLQYVELIKKSFNK